MSETFSPTGTQRIPYKIIQQIREAPKRSTPNSLKETYPNLARLGYETIEGVIKGIRGKVLKPREVKSVIWRYSIGRENNPQLIQSISTTYPNLLTGITRLRRALNTAWRR
jgi:hypothetical protein